MEPLLLIRDLSHGSHRQPRLRDINLTLRRGEHLALLGVNGAGKTTLLQIVAGMLKARRGDVLVGGVPLHAPGNCARRRLGYLPQHVACYPELSVTENLDWAGRLRGLSPEERRSSIAEILPQVGLEQVSARLAGRLSAGMLQRLGLAQALLDRPELLVLDEPTASLDPLQTEQIRDLLAALSADTSLLLATHLLDDVRRLCNRVAVMRQGQIGSEHAVSDDIDLLTHFHDPQEAPA